MAYTQNQLDVLQKALASGTLTITLEGQSMTTIPSRSYSARLRWSRAR